MKPAIVVPAISVFVEETRALLAQERDADALMSAYDKKLGEQREILKARRIELGMMIRKAHDCLPKNSRNGNGFSDYLGAIEMSASTAYKYMQDAGWVSGRSPRDGGNETQPSEMPSGDAPPHTDADAPHDVDRDIGPPPARGARDGWCTPEWLTAALPEVDLDPCSNPHSSVRAKQAYSLEQGKDGLALPWFGLVYVNGPYSELLPWAEKLRAEIRAIRGAGFLVNADNSPAWWHVLASHLVMRLDFNERIEFKPPPGIEPSTNDRPQTLLMSTEFWNACAQSELLQRGTLWIQQRGVAAMRT